MAVTYRAASDSTVYIGGVYERKGDGGVTKYYQACGRAVAMREVPPAGGAGTLLYLLADHLGGTVEVLDAAGATVAETTYWPYGATRAAGVAQTDKLYTGQQQEPGDAALGLYHYKARFYSTTLGRFVSADPTVPSARPVSLNRYAYVNNNPLTLRDPTGYDPTQQDLDNCAKNVVACLWWSAGGNAERYIDLVADWFAVPVKVLAAIVLNELQSRNLRDDFTEAGGSVCVRLGIGFCANASYGIAQIKLSTGRKIEKVAPEFQNLVHDDDFLLARLKNPLWAIAYAAAYMRYLRKDVFTQEAVRFLPHHVVGDADYIVAYRGRQDWDEWISVGGCDTCGKRSPKQIRKVRALEADAVKVLGAWVQLLMKDRSANQ